MKALIAMLVTVADAAQRLAPSCRGAQRVRLYVLAQTLGAAAHSLSVEVDG